jgi:hypothetical protein
VTDDVTVMSLPASLLQKVRVTTDRLCQIALNRKLSCQFKSGVNFQITLKQNRTKQNRVKRELPVHAHVYKHIFRELKCFMFITEQSPMLYDKLIHNKLSNNETKFHKYH